MRLAPVIFLVCGALAIVVAVRKQRPLAPWIIMGLLLGPVALLLALILPSHPTTDPRRPGRWPGRRMR